MANLAESSTPRRAIMSVAMALVFLLLVVGTMFHWAVNRVYVPVGQSLQLRYKGPLIFGSRAKAELGHWAKEGQIGILEKLRGPGRHFYCPIWYERNLVDDYVIQPGQVGIVKCNLGEPLAPGQFLVDGDIGDTKEKGILRKVLGPGRYRINPYGYEVKVVETVRGKTEPKFSGWVSIPTGYVGVVTNLTDNPGTGEVAGIQANVLPPGIYPINTHEKQVDVVEVGYRESTVAVTKQLNPDGTMKVDEAGEPMIAAAHEGINFPSRDGFPIHMDFTAIWGLMPDQAPHAIGTFGNVDQVEQKVVLPQIESICRNNGSEYSAVDLLVGEEREKFQQKNLTEFQQILTDKGITLLFGLVRHIYIPREVREPIQTAFIADELVLTRQQEQKTATVEADKLEAEKKVGLAAERVLADTKKQVAEKLAEGEKEVGETEAETRKLAAAIEKETAALEADAKLALGKAENEGKKLVEEATAQRFKLAVEAFGTAQAYNNWTFATNLPDNVDLKLLYAGEGTLWTDLGDVAVRATLPLKQPGASKPRSTASQKRSPTTRPKSNK